MIGLDESIAAEELLRHKVALAMSETAGPLLFARSEDDQLVKYICAAKDLGTSQLEPLIHEFEQYFGSPVKELDVPVEIHSTVPEIYVDYLNRMHGFLEGAAVIPTGRLKLEEFLAKAAGSGQQVSINPPINLLQSQAFYAKKSRGKMEIARISPHVNWRPSGELATVEYMVAYRK